MQSQRERTAGASSSDSVTGDSVVVCVAACSTGSGCKYDTYVLYAAGAGSSYDTTSSEKDTVDAGGGGKAL